MFGFGKTVSVKVDKDLYARIVKVMFLDLPRPEDAPVPFGVRDLGVVGLLSLAVLVMGVRFNWLLDRARDAGRVFTG